MEVISLSLEALHRNGHNLGLGDFDCAGRYDTPILTPVHLEDQMEWISFSAVNTDRKRSTHGVHFFLDDYIFERTWHDPRRYALLLSEFKAVMTPDFSLFTDYPRAVQIYNHYRKHLIGAYWQSRGISVIPSVCWSDHESFEWCFDGEPIGGTVAVSSVGALKSPSARALFMDGYNEMLRQLQPEKIIFYGVVPSGCEGNIERHSPFYTAVNARRRC